MKIIKIVSLLVSLFFIISCGSSKKTGERTQSFKKYLETRNIDIRKLNDSNYTDYYIEFLNDETKNLIMKNPYLKTNKVYVYQGRGQNIFCVFSDDGNEYLARIYKADFSVLAEPENGLVKLKQTVKLEFTGNFELTDTIIKIRRYVRELSGKEWNGCDLGVFQKDTIRLIEVYDTKKYSYKKKWLAKRYKTNYKFVYQPNLKATRIEATKDRNPSYLIEGWFNFRRDLKEEKILKLMEKVKY